MTHCHCLLQIQWTEEKESRTFHSRSMMRHSRKIPMMIATMMIIMMSHRARPIGRWTWMSGTTVVSAYTDVHLRHIILLQCTDIIGTRTLYIFVWWWRWNEYPKHRANKKLAIATADTNKNKNNKVLSVMERDDSWPPRSPVWCQLVTVPTDPFTTFTSPTGPLLSEWEKCQPRNTQNGGTRLPITNSESGSPVSYFSGFLVTIGLSRLVLEIFASVRQRDRWTTTIASPHVHDVHRSIYW